jgi:MFS family permease
MYTRILAVRDNGLNFFHRFEPGVWSVTAIGLLNSAAFAISLPFIALYLYANRGMSMTSVGLVIFSTGLISAATQLYSGALCDRIGRRPLLLSSVMAGTVLYAVMAVLVGTVAPIWLIIAVYALVRSALMMQRPAIQSMIVDLCPRERLLEANGVLRVGQNLGWAMGPAFGGYLLAFLPYGWLFGITALINLVVVFIAVRLIKETGQGSLERISLRGIFSAGRDRRFLAFTMLCTFFFLAMGQMGSTLSVFATERAGFSLAQYGTLLTLNGLMVAAFQYPMARLVNRLPHARALQLGSVFYTFSYLMLGLVGSYGLAFSAMVINTLGEMSIAPTTLAVVGEQAPPGARGRYMGFYGLSETMGSSLGPLWGGVLLDTFPHTPMGVWGFIALPIFLAGLGFRLWGRTGPSIRRLQSASL